MGDHRDQHAGQLHVDGVVLLAGRLVAGIEAAEILRPDQLPLLLRLQRNLGRHLTLGCSVGELAERALLPGRMGQHALLDLDFGRGHVPLAGGRVHQHGPRQGARLAIAVEGREHGGGTAGALHRAAERHVAVVFDVAGAALDPQLVAVGFQFFRHQGGNAEIAALPHVHVGGADRHDVVG
jgi:hypothetical protein